MLSKRLLKSRQFSCSELADGCQALVATKKEDLNDDDIDDSIKARCGDGM